jgi:MoxR-like ATPase
MHDGAVVRLIGRERELAVLEHAVARALSDEGGVTAISGEPGIGKTTLAHAIGIAVGQRGVPVLWGRGVESAPVYWPWLQVLRGRADAVGDAALREEAGRGARHWRAWRRTSELVSQSSPQPETVTGTKTVCACSTPFSAFFARPHAERAVDRPR